MWGGPGCAGASWRVTCPDRNRKGIVAAESSEGVAVLNYLGVMLRWKWLIVGITAACIAAGYGYLTRATPMYEAMARLLYVQPVTINNPLVQGSNPQNYGQPDIATVSAIVTSAQLNEAAFDLLEGKDTSAGYYMSATQPVDSAGNFSTNVVGIEAISADAQTAADAANAYAQAFVEYRRDSTGTQVEEALAAVEAQLQSYTTPAAQQSAEYLQLRQSQQALQLQLESLASDYAVISEATVPTEPFSPRKRHTLTLAAILGLALSVGLAFLLEQLDTRVRDERQMTDMLGLSVLGHLPALGRRTSEGATVQMLADPFGPMAEAVRVLRGNLSFTGIDGVVRSLLITSSVRSEGKSVTACNLAVSLALAGQRVVLVDADFRRPRVHTYMHVSNAVGFSSVLARRADLWDAVAPITLGGTGGAEADAATQSTRVVSVASSRRGKDEVTRYLPAGSDWPSGTDADQLLRVLPSGPLPPNPGEMAASQRFGEIIGMLAEEADVVVIDSPPLLEVGDTAAMAAKADGVLFVVNMAKVKWPMLERAHAQLMKFPSRKLGLVVIASKSVHKPVYGYESRGAPASSEDTPR